jgi:putative transcriptional regulator
MPAPLQSGTFLIASPALEGDPNFSRTVVLILRYVSGDNTLGVIINRPLGDKLKLYSNSELDTLSEGLEGVGEASDLFFEGGPVERGSLIFLHRLELFSEGATEIYPGLYAGGDLEAIRSHTTMAPDSDPVLRFYMGYSGWEAGQLENEIAVGAWILCPGAIDPIFTREPELIWQRALLTLDGKYRSMAFLPEDPSVN